MLTKDDLQNIGKLFAVEFPKHFKAAFSEEFPKAFAQEFPRHFKAAFSEEFPKAFDNAFPSHFKKAFENEYPRLRSEMYETVASAIDTYISPQFDEIRDSQKETSERMDENAVYLGMLYRETKKGFRYLKKMSDESMFFAMDEDEENMKKFNEDLAALEKKIENMPSSK